MNMCVGPVSYRQSTYGIFKVCDQINEFLIKESATKPFLV